MKSFMRTVVVLVVGFLFAGSSVAAGEERSAEFEREMMERRAEEEIRRAEEVRSVVQDQLLTERAEARARIYSWPGPRGQVAQPIVIITTGEVEAKETANIVEDMSVMSRIFDKALKEKFESERKVEGIYLQDYGALFLGKVNFPLVPPLKVEEEKKTEEPSSVWEQTKRELYGPREFKSPAVVTGRLPLIDDYFATTGKPAPETKYDAKKVEELRKKLLETLKQAANIRNLKPENLVVVAVLGVARTATVSVGLFGRGYGAAGKGDELEFFVPPDRSLLPPTVLTIHVKKADVDAFAKGELSFEEFRQGATILAY